jgi:hypothetical protein
VATTWYQGIDADLLGHANNKGWKLDDPKTAFETAAKAHREAQSKLGVPAEELLRLPRANASEGDIKSFRSKLGVPAEPKDYDLSGIKFAGSDLDQGFADSLRRGLYEAGVPKDNAQAAIKPVLKYLEDQEVEENAVMTAKVSKEMEDLNRSWGVNKDRNEFIAKSFLSKLALAAGVDATTATAAWDALSKVGGVGAAAAMKMLLEGGIRTGEDRYVSGGAPGSNMPLSREGALARLQAIKGNDINTGDVDFKKRLAAGNQAAKDEWKALHQVAFGKVA